MELELIRTYYPGGCNGELRVGGRLICYTIELSWKDNQKLRSCIPEGRYALKKRYSARYGWHLLVEGVPKRSLIFIHQANDALLELRGCIAPVTLLTAPGKELCSKNALERLKAVVYGALEKEPVFISAEEQG